MTWEYLAAPVPSPWWKPCGLCAQAQVDFQLAEQLFARARIRQPASVALWLGADVMLEYPLAEAADVLVRAVARR